jgi:hypothetical protein
MSAGTGVRRRARRHNAEAQWRAYEILGKLYGVSGTTIGKIVRRAGQ